MSERPEVRSETVKETPASGRGRRGTLWVRLPHQTQLLKKRDMRSARRRMFDLYGQFGQIACLGRRRFLALLGEVHAAVRLRQKALCIGAVFRAESRADADVEQPFAANRHAGLDDRSEEHTSE